MQILLYITKNMYSLKMMNLENYLYPFPTPTMINFKLYTQDKIQLNRFKTNKYKKMTPLYS